MSDQTDSTDLNLFDDEQAEEHIRRVWHDGRWFYSVIDVIGFLTESNRPRKYWSDLKSQLLAEGFHQLSARIGQLKMLAADGKQRLTDAADEETILRLVQSIPSPKVEPLKRWLAHVGAQRLQALDDPTLVADQMRKDYQRLGYSDAWITERLKNAAIRNELTAEWRARDADERREFAILTDTLSKGTFDRKSPPQAAGVSPRR